MDFIWADNVFKKSAKITVQKTLHVIILLIASEPNFLHLLHYFLFL